MTIWWCERCHASGVQQLDHLSVYDAVYRVEASHDKSRVAKTLGCRFDITKLRVEDLADAMAKLRPTAQRLVEQR